MNKFIIFFLMSTGVQAIDEVPTVVVLSSTNNRGVELKKEVVIINSSSVTVDQQKLSSTEIVTQAPFLKKINEFLPSTPLTFCESGTFKHIYKKDKIVKEENGCLNSARYKDLLLSFNSLKKDPITK